MRRRRREKELNLYLSFSGGVRSCRQSASHDPLPHLFNRNDYACKTEYGDEIGESQRNRLEDVVHKRHVERGGVEKGDPHKSEKQEAIAKETDAKYGFGFRTAVPRVEPLENHERGERDRASVREVAELVPEKPKDAARDHRSQDKEPKGGDAVKKFGRDE